jgi:hypothetical protein
MGCNNQGKGNNVQKAKGKGKGRGAAAKAVGGGRGPATDRGQSSSDKMAIGKLAKSMDLLTAAFAAKGFEKEPLKELWTCTACGDERCFAGRQECHKCGAPRAGALAKAAPPKDAAAAPPKTAAAAAPQTPPGFLPEMEEDVAVVEVPLEEQILSVEGDIKILKGAKTSALKAQLGSFEVLLQELRERQRKERPLPARLQAATHRLEKAAAAQAEASVAVANLAEQMVAAKVVLEEADDKLLEAEMELHGVKQQVADGQATVMASCFQHVLLQSMTQEQAQGLWAACMNHYGQMVAAGGAGVLPLQVAPGQQQLPKQPSQQPAGVAAAAAQGQTVALAAALGTMASTAQAAQVAAAAEQAKAEAQAVVAAQAAQVAVAAMQVHAQATQAAGQQQQQQQQQLQLQQQQQQQQQQLQQMQLSQLQQQQLQAAAAAGVLAGGGLRQSDLREYDLGNGQSRPRAAAHGARRVPSGGLGRSEASSDEELGGGRSRSVERRKLEKAARAEAKAAAAAEAKTAAEVQAGRQRTLEQVVQQGRV